jgi:hypothetical protein
VELSKIGYHLAFFGLKNEASRIVVILSSVLDGIIYDDGLMLLIDNLIIGTNIPSASLINKIYVSPKSILDISVFYKGF